ncbi:unnamed protein product [Phytophthora fragariaefolia]|uniref:Unnamed protein product n=1 Tax=Phytophthora fragariaefolia TaxID=1490495 RepID=A0A9W6XVR4_9STRA|nr:unnamed protein product [Phytophthora fragariaefolia]
MGDADSAQWNALHAVFGGEDSSFRVIMCYFHVAKKVYEKTRALSSEAGAMVLRHLHELHYARKVRDYNKHLADVQEEWGKWPQLATFAAYFKRVWLNERTWRWQCFHSPIGFAATNNPCETYNASLKRDVTLRRKLKEGTGDLINVIALPAPRVYDVHEKRSREDLPVTGQLGVETARMEQLEMPTTGWEVDCISLHALDDDRKARVVDAQRADGDAVVAAAAEVGEERVGARLHGHAAVLVVDLAIVLGQVEAVRVLGDAVDGAVVDDQAAQCRVLGRHDAERARGMFLIVTNTGCAIAWHCFQYQGPPRGPDPMTDRSLPLASTSGPSHLNVSNVVVPTGWPAWQRSGPVSWRRAPSASPPQ